MANVGSIEALKTEIDLNIVPNNNEQLITGQKVNTTMKDMVDTLAARDSDVVNNLTTDDPTRPLSAAQGYRIGLQLGLSEVERVDLVHTPTLSTTQSVPTTIVSGRKYRIYWSGATANSSVLSVSFGTANTTLQTTPLNITTLETANGYVEVTANVNATHLRIASRVPMVASVSLVHMEEQSGILDRLKDSLYNAFPTTDLFWVDHYAINASTGALQANQNCICSRTFLPIEKYCPDKIVRFLAFTDNTYNFAVSVYSAASESSHLGRIGFTIDKEISIESYSNARYIRLSLVYKDPTNTDVISAGVSAEFDLQNLFMMAQASLQDVAVPANTSVRIGRKPSEILHKKLTSTIASGQGFCKFDNYWLVGLSSGTSFNAGSTNSSYINIYNESFALVGRITHNLGHMSCLSYCASKNAFICSNGNADEYPRLDILLNASEHIHAALQSQTSEYLFGTSDVMSIPLHTSSKDLMTGNSDGGVWCFGGNDRFVYISVRDRVSKIRHFFKGILGVGSSNFSDWGTYVSGKTSDQYNGTLKILEHYAGDNISSVQGIDYKNGKLIVSSSTDRIKINVINLIDNAYQIIEHLSISNLLANGSEQDAEPEDLTITEDGMFINTSIGMFQFFL